MSSGLLEDVPATNDANPLKISTHLITEVSDFIFCQTVTCLQPFNLFIEISIGHLAAVLAVVVGYKGNVWPGLWY